jgi:hypothetical protein
MEPRIDHNELIEDQKLVETLFSKADLLNFDAHNKQVPNDYFNQFEQRTLDAIISSKPKAILYTIGSFAKLAIAASFLIIATTVYIYLPSNKSSKENLAVVNLQEIPSSEIDSYINANETIAEIDWQTEINKEGSNLEDLNSFLNKDSNQSKQ